MAYEVTWEGEGLYLKFYGTITAQEVNAVNNEMYGDPRFDGIKYQIWDSTDALKFELTERDADVAAATDASTVSYKPVCRCALVATDTEMRRLIERYIEKSLEKGSSWEFKLFERIEDARKWGVPDKRS